MSLLVNRAFHIAVIAGAALEFSACSSGTIPRSAPQPVNQLPQSSGPTQPVVNTASACATAPVKSLQVTPNSLTLTLKGGAGRFTACTQYAGSYTLSVAPAGIVSVPGSATPITNPVTGIKSALIPVTPLAPGGATITVTDKKGNTARVAITVAPSVPRIYVANFGNNTVTVYDEEGNQIKGTLPFPGLNGPAGIAFDPDNNHLYVINSNNNTMTVYDEGGNPVGTTGKFPNLHGLQCIAFDTNNHHLYVGSSDLTVLVYDEEGNQITISGNFPNVNPAGIAFDPNNRQLYVTGNGVLAFDEEGNPVNGGAFSGDFAPSGIAFDTHNHQFYVAWLHGIPQEGGFESAVFVYGEAGNFIDGPDIFFGVDSPLGIAFDPHNNELYFVIPASSVVTVTDEVVGIIKTAGSFPNVNVPRGIAVVP